MLQLGDEVSLYSLVFVVVLLGTRSPVWTTVLTASLYLFLAMFRFPQVATSRALQVLHPASQAAATRQVSVVAHRGGGHDAPENTIAAIREVRAASPSFVLTPPTPPKKQTNKKNTGANRCVSLINETCLDFSIYIHFVSEVLIH